MRVLFAVLLICVAILRPDDAVAQIAVRGEVVYTMAGEPLADGVVLVNGATIERVGPAASVSIPDGYRVMEARVVTPGLIDAHSTVGLSGIFNQPDEQDQLDRSNAIQPHLRAIDAYNPREELVAYLRDRGITTVHTGHGPGALVSGQTMIVKTHGITIDEVLVDSAAALAVTLGPGVSRNFDSPGTRSRGVAMLRQRLIAASEYAASAKENGRDLELEVLATALAGEIPVMITAHRVTDIMAALRLADEFGFRLILDGVAEGYLVMDEIQAAGVPVVVHPAMARAGGELVNASFETASKLRAAGIPMAFQSGYEAYVPKTRVVLFEAGVAAANGMTMDDALATLTIDAAGLLGIQSRVGSLEAGKDADLVLFDGDPLEYTSHVCGVIIGGEIVSETCH